MNERLLTNHSSPLNFSGSLIFFPNIPVSSKEPDRIASVVRDHYIVSKCKPVQKVVRFCVEIDRRYRDRNFLSDRSIVKHINQGVLSHNRYSRPQYTQHTGIITQNETGSHETFLQSSGYTDTTAWDVTDPITFHNIMPSDAMPAKDSNPKSDACSGIRMYHQHPFLLRGDPAIRATGVETPKRTTRVHDSLLGI